MAIITATIPMNAAWEAGDRLQLVVGDEGGADLANSTPAGGTVIHTVPCWPDDIVRTVAEIPQRVLEADYRPTDKCATMPVGVRSVDSLGNISAVDEQLVHLRDPPKGARNLTASSSGSPNEVGLNWTKSPEV